MNITPEMWQDIHSSAVLQVVDGAAVWVDLSSDPPPYTGLVLDLQFPDSPGKFTVLYRLTPAMAVRVAHDLLAHVESPVE